MTIQAATDGHLLSVLDGRVVAPHLASGSLVRVLEDWCPPFARFARIGEFDGTIPKRHNAYAITCLTLPNDQSVLSPRGLTLSLSVELRAAL